MKRAIASFELEIVFDSRRFDPEQNLQVAWYDPTTEKHNAFCDHFTSDPRSAKKLTSETIVDRAFDRREVWTLEASIAYAPDHIDIETARLDVLEFDQKTGSLLEKPRNARIVVRSKGIRHKSPKKRSEPAPETMEQALKSLLDALETIQEGSPDITDTEVREATSEAVWNLFIVPRTRYIMPKSFLLDSAKANRAVAKALKNYVEQATSIARASGISSFRDRLAAFQNLKVVSEGGYTYDDFFGWTDPKAYDIHGEPKR